MPRSLTFDATRIAPHTADEWEALADRTGAGPFVRPGWFAAFAHAFGRDVRVLTARRGGRLAGVLPLAGARGSVVSPTNWHSPAYGAVTEDRVVAAALAARLLDGAPARVDLAFLDPGEPFAPELLAAARRARRLVIARPVLRSPFLRLDGDFAAYWATRPARLRREIGRRRRRLAGDHGEVAVAFEDGGERLDALLAEGFAVEGSGWKTERGTAIAVDPRARLLYEEVARWAAARGWLELGFVRVAGRPVAFHYALVLDGTVHVLKVGFDRAFARYAVGTLMTCAAIERAYTQGLRVYDFLGAEEPYKLDWTGDVRERLRVQAFARSPRGAGGWAAWRFGRPAAQRVLAAARRGPGARR